LKTHFYIARRYLFSKSGNNAINNIIAIASLGVVIVSAAFIIVLSGFSGIRTFNLDLIKLTDPELKILPKKHKNFIFSDSLSHILSNEKYIENYSKILEEKVFINFENKQKIAKLKGVDSNYYKIIRLDTLVFMGNTPQPMTSELMIGMTLANDLSFTLSTNEIQSIDIMVPKPGKGIITDPRKSFNEKYFFPVGVFQTSADFDQMYLYTNIGAVQKLLSYPNNRISSIEIKSKNPQYIESLKKSLQKKLDNKFIVKNRKDQNPLIFKMLNNENLMTYLVLSLILLLALFNITGSIMMIIINKKSNIITLQQLGLNFFDIKKIFLIQGFGMTSISGVIGLIIGLVLVIWQLKFPFLYIPQTTMAYPVELHLYNILWVLLTITVMGLISTYVAVRSLRI